MSPAFRLALGIAVLAGFNAPASGFEYGDASAAAPAVQVIRMSLDTPWVAPGAEPAPRILRVYPGRVAEFAPAAREAGVRVIRPTLAQPDDGPKALVYVHKVP